ncbi:MAG: efflux RND transporter periplasmic adaptor subunit [Chthoniobacteraceae bacterium]
MKAKLFWLLLVIAAAVGGWYLGSQRAGHNHTGAAPAEKKVLFYQSAMHPHIKSDKPGNCTICGMKLTPVYEGQAPLESGSAAMAKLDPRSLDVMHVETTEVRVQPLRRTLRVAGTIEDDDANHQRLSAYVDGRIDKLMVRFNGAEVVAGQPLAHLYSPTLLTARDEYLLLLGQSASPQRDRMLQATRQRLERLGLTAQQIDRLPRQETAANYIEILAPISGTVIQRNVYEGQYVKEGEVLFEIANFDKMWFVFNAYERDLAWIAPGQKVEVTTPSVPGKIFTAPIDFIEPNLDPETRSARVRVVLENPLIGEAGQQRRLLLYKVYAEALVHVETPEVLAVPRSAVLSPGGVPLVYVDHGEGAYEARPVRLGRAGDNAWEVVQGLEAGEVVVTTGNMLIDAQAQLDHGGEMHSHGHAAEPAEDSPAAPATPLAALTDSERQSATALLQAVDALGQALAADDLNAYNSRLGALAAPVRDAVGAFRSGADGIRRAAALQPAEDLSSARKAFYPFSKAMAAFARDLQSREPGFANVKVFECPMVRDAVPNAPERKGRWVQLSAELRNPFFGAEMLECGTEVKP